MSDHVSKLRKHLEEILGSDAQGLESFEGGTGFKESLSEMSQNQQETDMLMQGLEHLEQGTEIFEGEAFALEAIVLPRQRPVLDIITDTFYSPPPPWRHLADENTKTLIDKAILSIGRIEIPTHPTIPYAGTGFIVGKDLLMTNRHVAEIFTTGLGIKDLTFISGRSPGIDFKQEVIPSTSMILTFEKVILIHPYWDCALIQVNGLPENHPTLELAEEQPSNIMNQDVVVIGYPAQDPRNDLDLQNRVFRGVYQRKRMSPGKLKDYRNVRSYDNTVKAIAHDASTLGGNSGSAVIDIQTGLVVGLHFAGLYLESNYAVPTWRLAIDSKVVDAGVNFKNEPTIDGDAPWADSWKKADPETQDSQGLPRAANPVDSSDDDDDDWSILGLDWFERVNDSVLLEALARSPNKTRNKLIDVLGQDEADELIKDLSEQDSTEGLFSTDPDPSLPEIIYLHGVMGSHLANHHGEGSRVWFNFLAFAKGNIAEKLKLNVDGLTDNHPGLNLSADGHLRLKYSKAARRWRNKGYIVHEFSYDWRKPIHTSADQLHAFIEQLAAGNPNRQFAIVAHSMGGLVSSIYAQRHPSWADRIQRAVFIGSPLGGSYTPIEALQGIYPFFKTLAALSRHDDIADLQKLSSTLPGLLEMLPNPQLFEDPANFYTQDKWPDDSKLMQRWLNQSLNIKDEILSSPLLSRTFGIVSREFGTVSSVVIDQEGVMKTGSRTAPGDGTVPIKAAAVTELADLWEASGDRHADLCNNKEVIYAVDDLLRSGYTNILNNIRVKDIDFEEVLPETETPEIPLDKTKEILKRMEEGRLTAADVNWLLDPLGHEAPD